MVKKNILALTLMGLMALAFIFPVCANALDGEVPPTLLEPEADLATYELMPTFEWSAASGPTKFELTIGIDDAAITVTVDDGNVIDDLDSKTDPKEKKWDKDNRLAASEANAIAAAGNPDDTKNCFGNVCWYEYTPTEAIAIGVADWQIKAIREGMPKDNFDGANAISESRNLNVLGDITLSLVADKTEADIDGTVKVTVSMDNLTNGDIPVDTLTFTIGYNDDVVTAPTDATPAGTRTSGFTPVVTLSGSGATAKATVELTENIIAGTDAIVELDFTVAGAGSNTFALTAGDIEITSTTVNPPAGETQNPAAVGGTSAALTVAEPVTQGDLDGNDAVTLADAVIAMKVLVGLDDDLTPEEAASVNAHVTAYPTNVDAAVLVYILKTVAG